VNKQSIHRENSWSYVVDMINKKQLSFQLKKDTGKGGSKDGKRDPMNKKENRMNLYYKDNRTQLYR